MDTRVAFELGFLRVYWYGLLVTLGVLAGTWVAALEAKRRGDDPNVVWDSALWVILLGLIGARLYHVFSSPNDGSQGGWAYYSQHPIQIIAIWQGGLGIYGGLFGGALGILLVCIRRRLRFLRLADSIAPGVLLGQAIGRWGNYFNQELYGGPTGSSWWGITIDPPYRIRTPSADFTDLTRYPPETRFHPTFLYESIWNLVGFIGLLWLARRRGQHLREGDIGAAYLIWYGSGRLWIELLFRPDAWTLGGVPVAVWLSLFIIAVGMFVVVLNRRFSMPQPATHLRSPNASLHH
ncbi:MAG: prolipoprotein diacylglyceryl transferase [Chloroflexi bacterium]|jgi:phosphatidylglycerol:prolipoprotein diacylglycerol transferase|nr:prolipoprotein diacylglyceryl transferase [Chloroflexota bacterium]